MLSRSATSPAIARDSSSLAVNPGSPPNLARDGASLQSPQPLSPPSQTSSTSDSDLKHEPLVQNEPLPRFTVDPPGQLTHDKTTVDIVAVPCPGGHPLRSWNRDGLMSRYYGALSMRDAEVKDESERPSPSWVRQGIRREADKARILLYEHPGVEDGMTLSTLADALLQDLQHLRELEDRERPVVFIGHSVGGMVVKLALVKAGRDARYENILRECYGVAFFGEFTNLTLIDIANCTLGTPHQGSSYFSMPSLACSIQSLLQLSAPLPSSVTDDLRVGNSFLIHIDEDFKAVSNDLQVWTFYETIDSRLSGGSTNSSDARDVYFTAPLTSIKSAILGMRQERIFPLQSDHANIASFGRHNVHTLHLFLKQLSHQIHHADVNVTEGGVNSPWKLGLDQKVNVEVHGFFDDPPVSQHQEGEENECPTVRAWSTRLPLREFLNKGPDECLSERLNEVEGSPDEGRFLRHRGRTSLMSKSNAAPTPLPVTATDPLTVKNALGIQDTLSSAGFITSPASPVFRPVDSHRQVPHSAPVTTPLGPITPPSRALSPKSSPMRHASPLVRADFEQDLAVDRLSPPLRGRMGRSISRSFSLGSDGSRFEYRDFPPFSQRSRSAMGDVLGSDDEDLESPRLPDAVVAIRRAVKDEKGVSETVIVDEVPMAFVKPDMKSRKFVWVHVPFNNPTWVKVSLMCVCGE